MNRFKRALGVLLGYEQGEMVKVEKTDIPDAPDDLYELAVMALERVSNEPGAFDEEDYGHIGHRVWRIISNGVFSERQQRELNVLYQKAYIERKRDDAKAKLLRVAMLGKEAFEDPAKTKYQGTQVYNPLSPMQPMPKPPVVSAQGRVFRKES